MNKIVFYLCCAFSVLLFSCSKQDEVEKLTPVINISVEGDVIALGNEASVNSYAIHIDHPIKGEMLVAKIEDFSSWVKISSLTDSVITLKVEENSNNKERTTSLILSYKGAKDKKISISQSAKDEPNFEIKLSNQTYNGVTVDVIPSEKNFEYIWNLMEKKDFEKYKSENALLANLIKTLKQEYENAKQQDPYISISDVLQRADDKKRINGLEAGKSYVLVAVGIDAKHFTTTTGLNKLEFKSPAFVIKDPCTFNISFKNVTTTSLGFTITPSDNSCRYYYGICPATLLNEMNPEKVAEQFIKIRDNNGEFDWTRHNVLSTGIVDNNTTKMNLSAPLVPNTEYAILAFGVGQWGERTTNVATAIKKTNAIKQSDMQISMSLVKKTEKGAILRIDPSVKNEPYMFGCIKKEQYAKYKGKDKEFIDYVIKVGNLEIFKGDQTIDKTNRLIAATDYVCFAFGYDGGPTTGLFTFEFSTPKAVLDGSAKLILQNIQYRVWAKDNKYAEVIFEVSPNETAEHWRAQPFMTKDGVILGKYGITMNDQEASDFLFSTSNQYVTIDKKMVIGHIEWGKEITCYSIAVDKKGKKGPLMKFKFDVPQKK